MLWYKLKNKRKFQPLSSCLANNISIKSHCSKNIKQTNCWLCVKKHNQFISKFHIKANDHTRNTSQVITILYVYKLIYLLSYRQKLCLANTNTLKKLISHYQKSKSVSSIKYDIWNYIFQENSKSTHIPMNLKARIFFYQVDDFHSSLTDLHYHQSIPRSQILLNLSCHPFL